MAKVKQKSILARNIILRRKALGMNQEAFASKVGIGKTTLAEIETDVSEGWLSTRKAIADYLKCSVEDLYKNPDAKDGQSPLDQAVMLTQAQLKTLSEEAAKNGAQAVIDAVNKPSVEVLNSDRALILKLIDSMSDVEIRKLYPTYKSLLAKLRTRDSAKKPKTSS